MTTNIHDYAPVGDGRFYLWVGELDNGGTGNVYWSTSIRVGNNLEKFLPVLTTYEYFDLPVGAVVVCVKPGHEDHLWEYTVESERSYLSTADGDWALKSLPEPVIDGEVDDKINLSTLDVDSIVAERDSMLKQRQYLLDCLTYHWHTTYKGALSLEDYFGLTHPEYDHFVATDLVPEREFDTSKMLKMFMSLVEPEASPVLSVEDRVERMLDRHTVDTQDFSIQCFFQSIGIRLANFYYLSEDNRPTNMAFICLYARAILKQEGLDVVRRKGDVCSKHYCERRVSWALGDANQNEDKAVHAQDIEREAFNWLCLDIEEADERKAE